jgi:lysozyme family protein
MATYDHAYDDLMKHEGSKKWGWYSNDKSDHGGETLAGITRKNFPNWPGWVVMDSYKSKPGWPRNWEQDQLLWALIKQFYQSNFWAPIYARITDEDKASHIFSLAVNSGVYQGHKLIQRMFQLQEDGVFGSKTLAAVNSDTTEDFHLRLKTVVGHFYDDLAKKDPTQAKFEHSWHSRLS